MSSLGIFVLLALACVHSYIASCSIYPSSLVWPIGFIAKQIVHFYLIDHSNSRCDPMIVWWSWQWSSQSHFYPVFTMFMSTIGLLPKAPQNFYTKHHFVSFFCLRHHKYKKHHQHVLPSLLSPSVPLHHVQWWSLAHCQIARLGHSSQCMAYHLYDTYICIFG